MTPRRFVQHMSSIMRHPLSQERPWGAVERFVRWQVGSRLLREPVVVPFTDHAKLIVRTGMTGATCNIYTGLHDFAEMGFTVHALRAGDHFVDVGANVGAYTVLAGAVAKAHCTTFEPAPSTFANLMDNIRANGIDVDARRCAVGATRARLKFAIDAFDTTSHVAAPGEDGIDVDVVALDDALATPPTLMKIDVEGFESPVLDGATRTLADPRLIGVIMETNGSGERYGGTDEDLLGRMLSLGFGRFSYEPLTRELVPDKGGKNTIFVRGEAAVAAKLRAAPSFKVRGRAI